MKNWLLTWILVSIFSFTASAQLFVDSMLYSPAGIAMDFFDGTCVDVSSVTFTGEPGQLRFFEGSQSGLGVNAGILFASGDGLVAVGPNSSTGASQGYNIPSQDSMLASITTGPLFDVSMLHFKIVPHTDSIGFDYVFASEEYCEYVNSNFNDAFGFWIKGPGLSDPNGQPKNIALVPGTAVPVSINNVNYLTNTAYYQHNEAPGNFNPGCDTLPVDSTRAAAIQFDGLTTVLTASAQVVPDSSYDVWIGIADVSDGIYDSGIFLSVQSLCGNAMLSPQASFAMQIVGNTVTFGNDTKYATAWHWDFGDGTTSDARYPSHTYANLDQQYTVTLVASNYCCSDVIGSTVGVSATGEIADREFKIYPNPVLDELVISPVDGQTAGLVLLTDVSGRTVLNSAFSGKIVLSTKHLTRGIYFLNITTLDGRKMVKKITK